MEDRRIIIEKRIEYIIGILFLIPSLFGLLFIFAMVFNLGMFYESIHNWGVAYDYFPEYKGLLSALWSALPAFIAIMALVGAYLTKDKLRYFIKDKKDKSST